LKNKNTSSTVEILPFILGFWLLFRVSSAMDFFFDMKSYGAPDSFHLFFEKIILVASQ